MRSNRRQRATLLDVAMRAGVSKGTVSRALSGSELVNERTRAWIIQVAEDLGYVPDVHARRLSTGQTLTIAVVIPFFTTPSASERLSGAVAALAPTRFDLLIQDIETPKRRRECFKTLPQVVDGILVVSVTPTDEEALQLANTDSPVVLIDADHHALGRMPRIMVDDVAGGALATRHLIELGHRRIAFVGDVVKNPYGFHSSRDRFKGYCEALEEAQINPDTRYYREGAHGRLPARESALELLRIPDAPTAIFAASDMQAVGVLEAAKLRGLRVPEDLSVVGYDDIEIADIMGLTTVNQALVASGRFGVELLLKLIDGSPQMAARHLLPTVLVKRATTGPSKARS